MKKVTLAGRKHGETWWIDENMRDLALELQQTYTEDLGHIDLGRVVFVRVVDLPSNRQEWLGKCWYVKEPINMMVHHVITWLDRYNFFQEPKTSGPMPTPEQILDQGILDVRYIIALNEGAMANRGFLGTSVEKAVLHHELKHINEEMNGIEEHNVKDFRSVLHAYGIDWSSSMPSEENWSRVLPPSKADSGDGESS